MFIRRVSWTLLAFVILAAPVFAGVGSFGDSADAASSRVAVIKELKGTVKVKKAGGSKEFTAFAKMSLNQGDILSTGAGASAVLQFANGTAEDDKMTVSANTKLTFSKLSDRNGTTTKVSMWSGSAWADVKSITSKDDEFKLETPTAVMGVRGTHLLVSVDPTTGDTRLIVAAGVVRTETTGSGERQAKDVYPTQRALITDDKEEQPGDIHIAPVDLSLLMSQSDENIVSAILGSAAEIMDENRRYSDQYAQEGLPEPLGETPEDLNRFKSNTENLLGAIADQAVKSGLLTQERLDRIVSEVKEQSGLTIDLSKKQLDTTEADKKKQEEQRKLEAEQKKKAEEQRKKELERRSAEEALLKQVEEAKKKLAEANKKAEEEKKRKALETYESGLSGDQKAKYEQEKKNREAEQAAQSPSPSPSSTPPPASQPVPSNIATLSDLKIFGSTLMGFNANTTSYSLNVSSETAEVSVSPFVTSGSNATVKVGGVAVTSGSATSVILAPAGSSTVIEVVVTAENGVDKKTYRVTINRTAAVNMPPTDIVLSNPNVDEGTPQGTVVSEITAVDPDSGPPFEFDLVSVDGITDDNDRFYIIFDSDHHIYQLAVNDELDYETKSTLSVRLRVIDNLGASFEKALTVHVLNVDESPNADDVTGLSVNEDETLTGTLSGSDPDGDELTFMLDTNASQGSVTVIANGNFSYTPNANYYGTDEFRYKVYDGTTYSGTAVVYINVIPVNDAPTDITLSNATIAENSEADSIIGSLSATGPDSGDTFTYALVSGEGSDDNASFSISGTNLLTGAPLNYESKTLFHIRVRVTDSGGLTYEKSFEIHISDVNEPPIADVPTGLSVNEDETLTGMLTGSDPEGNALDFMLVTPAAHAMSISIGSNGDFSYTPYPNYSGTDEFTFKVSDGNSFSAVVTATINVIPFNDEPTNITLSNATIAENSGIGFIVGALGATDPDSGDTFTYTLVSGDGDSDNASFSISGANLLTAVPVNYESKNLYHIRVRVTDSEGLTYEKALEIHITDVDESLTNIAISDLDFFDYTTKSEAIGTLVPTGGEGGITYALVAGTGDGDNTQFAINGNLLLTSASYDDGFKVTYNIRVRATDSNGSLFEKNLTLVTTKYFTYTDIVDYASGARTYSSVVSGVPRVSGHEFFASLSSAAIGIQIAMRADFNQPSEFYWNGSETPINVGRYYVTPVAGWNEALLKVTDPDNIIREYKFHIWAGDTLPANLALASITAKDSASQALSPSVDGANPLLWRAYVADPSATYVDFSPQFAAGTQITRVILANGQYAEASGALENGYRIPYTGTPTYAYIYVVGSDGKPYVYKLIIEPMSS